MTLKLAKTNVFGVLTLATFKDTALFFACKRTMSEMKSCISGILNGRHPMHGQTQKQTDRWTDAPKSIISLHCKSFVVDNKLHHSKTCLWFGASKSDPPCNIQLQTSFLDPKDRIEEYMKVPRILRHFQLKVYQSTWNFHDSAFSCLVAAITQHTDYHQMLHELNTLRHHMYILRQILAWHDSQLSQL